MQLLRGRLMHRIETCLDLVILDFVQLVMIEFLETDRQISGDIALPANRLPAEELVEELRAGFPEAFRLRLRRRLVGAEQLHRLLARIRERDLRIGPDPDPLAASAAHHDPGSTSLADPDPEPRRLIREIGNAFWGRLERFHAYARQMNRHNLAPIWLTIPRD